LLAKSPQFKNQQRFERRALYVQARNRVLRVNHFTERPGDTAPLQLDRFGHSV
jgi:hypothetical protein